MNQRIHWGSVLAGAVIGAATIVLLGAKPATSAPAAAPPAATATTTPDLGRYTGRVGSREGTVTAFVVDTATGKVAVVQDNGVHNMVAPEWNQP